MSVARAERLVNLVLCLLSTRQYLTADRIRRIVPGYADAPTDDAYFRMFERDKTELRELGIPLEVGRNSAFDTIDGYRIARRDYELGEIDLEPDEAAAVALAVRLWDSPELTGAAHGALLKLRAAGVQTDLADDTLELRVDTRDPAFPALWEAVRDRRAVVFDYRSASSDTVLTRTVEPWGVVSRRGKWYVVGHDRGRRAQRVFRLSRIVGEVRPSGRPGAVVVPEGVDLREMVGFQESPAERTALIRVRPGACQGLRQLAVAVREGGDWDEAEVRFHDAERLAGWIASLGADAVVVEPPDAREAVIRRLKGALA